MSPRCKCGCGKAARWKENYARGHYDPALTYKNVKPAGMTYARALEIAIESAGRVQG